MTWKTGRNLLPAARRIRRKASMKTRHKVLLARVASSVLRGLRHAVGRGDTVEVTRGGYRWRLDLREGIDLAIYLFGHFEPSTVAAYRRIIRPGDVVIDVGANIGAHTLCLADCVGPKGRVIAFEPTEYAVQKLRANIALNPTLAQRITVEQIHLGASDDVAPPAAVFSSWPLGAERDRHALHYGVAQRTTHARACRLDSYLDDHDVRRVDFMKIDIDGYECEMLAGAATTLRQLRPALTLELAPYALAERGGSVEALVGVLDAAGYVFYSERAPGRPLDVQKIIAQLPAGASRNVVARPG
jgi:FkbM family methyltransferase